MGQYTDLPEQAERHIEFEPNTGCWLWAANCNWNGYGLLKVKRVTYAAHRYVYRAMRGAIPSNLTLDHLCRVRSCVNPSHLEPVTMRINTLRGNAVTALNFAKTHCLRGHEFTVANTYLWKGHRACKACRKATRRLYELA